QHVHMPKDRVQLTRERREPRIIDLQSSKRCDVSYVVECDRHYSHPRSSPACAATSVLRPIAGSSKSTRTLSSRPDPDISAITPEPNVLCLTFSPTRYAGASCETSASSANRADRDVGAVGPYRDNDTGTPGRLTLGRYVSRSPKSF